MPDRVTQLNALLLEEISLFYQHEMPELFFTVTRVNVSPDLREARVWVSFIDKRQSSLEILAKHLGTLGRYLGKRLRLRRVPHIHLILDTGMEYAEHVSAILQSTENG